MSQLSCTFAKDQRRFMLSDFGVILLFLIGGAIFALVGITAARLLRPNRPNPEKLASYECGEEALGDARTQFNPRFYVIALIFVIFDVELAFLFPVATVFGLRSLIEETDGLWGWFALTEIVIFVTILALGLAYAWRKGHLDWIKPKPVIPVSNSKVPLDLYEQINKRYEKKAEVIS